MSEHEHRWTCNAMEVGQPCMIGGGHDWRHFCIDCGIRRDVALAAAPAVGEGDKP